LWEIPSVNAIDTRIDDRCRPGCLTGLVKPGERFSVQRVSPVEIRMRLIVTAEMPAAKLGQSHGRTVLVGGKLTAAAVAKELEAFP
jgi:hypothetical protein